MDRKGSVDKNKNVENDDKGKGKLTVDRIRNQMNKTWVKKSDSDAGNLSHLNLVLEIHLGINLRPLA